MRYLAALLFLASCAAPEKTVEVKPLEAPPLGIPKAQVRALLGPATEVPFDSGYEVWVYRQPAREKEKIPAKELVLLFSPEGTLTKTRFR